MTATEILVIAGGLALGFWGATFLMRRRDGVPPAPPGSAPHGAFDSALRAEPGEASLRWHAVLELSPSASAEEIRNAYRRLMSQYHPDKVASAGVELQALAERKSKQIGEAYREAMKARGIDA